jgi:hypothetical protein
MDTISTSSAKTYHKKMPLVSFCKVIQAKQAGVELIKQTIQILGDYGMNLKKRNIQWNLSNPNLSGREEKFGLERFPD